MEYEKRSQLLNRIFAGSFYGAANLDGLPFVLFKHPTLKVKNQSDYIYNSSYQVAKKQGALTEAESIDVAIKQQIWSRLEECNIDNLKKYIEKLDKDLVAPINKYNSHNQDNIKKKKSDSQIKLAKLQFKRAAITSNTAEKYAETRKHEYIVREIAYLPETGTKLFNSNIIYNYNLMELVSELAEIYFIKDVIGVAQIRELARSNPWRLYYSPAKTIHINLFERSPANYTDEQINLLYWSSIYDYVYESTDRPDDHTINTDELLDKWLESQDAKNKKGAAKTQSSYSGANSKRTGPGITEVFIPCSPDKAEEIEALNSPVVRAAKKKMFQRLNEKGTLNEWQAGAIFEGVS